MRDGVGVLEYYTWLVQDKRLNGLERMVYERDIVRGDTTGARMYERTGRE